jgi:Oxidoreductase family, NAD-binding Rossmann fold
MNISRRKIIKSLGMVAGATATGMIPGISLFANGKNETKENGFMAHQSGVKAVLIGAGKRGWRFGKFSKKHPDQLQIIAIGEPLADRRREAANALGLTNEACLNNWEEVFEKQTGAGVAIIAASGNYMEACTKALRAGYHVWVDRPVSMEPNEVIAINKLARESNRELNFCFIHEGKLNFMDHHLFEKNPAEA